MSVTDILFLNGDGGGVDMEPVVNFPYGEVFIRACNLAFTYIDTQFFSERERLVIQLFAKIITLAFIVVQWHKTKIRAPDRNTDEHKTALLSVIIRILARFLVKITANFL